MNQCARRIESGGPNNLESDSIQIRASLFSRCRKIFYRFLLQRKGVNLSMKHIFRFTVFRYNVFLLSNYFFSFFFLISSFYRIRIIFAFVFVNLFEKKFESKKKKIRQSSIAVAFTRSPFLLDRGYCACLPGRHGVPPLRSWGQSISNLTFLPTNDLVHRRIYESAFPLLSPFLSFVFIPPLSFQKQSHFLTQFRTREIVERSLC